MANNRSPRETELMRSVGQLFQRALEERGLSRRAASKRYKQPASYAKSIIDGRNLTLRSLVRIFDKLEMDVVVVVKNR